MTIFGKTNWLEKINYHGNTRLSTKTLMEKSKTKCVLLEDEALDRLQIRTAVSLPNVKGNKAIKKNC